MGSDMNQPDSSRPRRIFTITTFCFATGLLGWGAFVTSINAGLAVPDWPTSFNSLDPFNPWPEWWTITPVLAEHGHRLLGAIVGLLTMILAFWTYRSDQRRWMRSVGIFALGLVAFQGLLGGLRVIWISLNLAMVHAAVAQLFFALLASMILFVSPTWHHIETLEPLQHAGRLKRLSLLSAGLVFIQILLGALLRHPGTGIDPVFAAIHIGFAFIASATVLQTWFFIRFSMANERELVRFSGWTIRILVAQVLLGLFAYFVLLDEKGLVVPGNVQVVINSAHLVVGALLFASVVLTALLARHRREEPS